MSRVDQPAGIALTRVILGAADELRGQASALNELDAVAGDGDLGITVGKAAAALRAALGGAEGDVVQVLRRCGASLAAAAPSTSGTLLAMGFLAAAKALAGQQGSATGQMAEGFAAATREVQLRGKASRGDKTMLDVLEPVSACLYAAAREGHSVSEALQAAAAVAIEATEATRGLTARAGRAKWMQDRGTGQPDAGCQMLSIAITRAADIASADSCRTQAPPT